MPLLLLLLLVVSLPDQLHAINCKQLAIDEASDVSKWFEACSEKDTILLSYQGVLDLSSLVQGQVDTLFKRNKRFSFTFGVKMTGSKIKTLEIIGAASNAFSFTLHGGFTVEESPNLEEITIKNMKTTSFNFEAGKGFVVRRNPKLKSFTFPTDASQTVPFQALKWNNLIDEATLALLKDKTRNSFSGEAEIQERGECAFLEAVKDVKELNACTSFGGHLRFEPTITGAVKPTLMMGMDAKLTVVKTGLEKLELTNMTDNATVTDNLKLCHAMFYSPSMTGNCPHKCNSPKELDTKQCSEVEGDVELGGGTEDETRAQNMVNVVTIRGRLSLDGTAQTDLKFLGKLKTIQAGQNPALSVINNADLKNVFPPSLTSLQSTDTVEPMVVIDGNKAAPNEQEMKDFGQRVGLPYDTSKYNVTLGAGLGLGDEEKSDSSSYIIIGAAVGGVVLLVVGAIVAVVYVKRQKKKKQQEKEAEEKRKRKKDSKEKGKDPLRSKTRDASSSMSVVDEGKGTVKNKEAELVKSAAKKDLDSKNAEPKKKSAVQEAPVESVASPLKGDIVHMESSNLYDPAIWRHLQEGRRYRVKVQNVEYYITDAENDTNIQKMLRKGQVCQPLRAGNLGAPEGGTSLPRKFWRLRVLHHAR